MGDRPDDSETTRDAGPRRGSDGRVGAAGNAATVGALLWTAAPWVERAVYGDRPYVGTEFDLLSFVNLLAVEVGIVGFQTSFEPEYGRFGAVGVASTGAGIAVLAVLAGRSVLAVLTAGFRAVPATGEDPAGLILTFAWVLGVGLATLGAALRRLAGRWTPVSVSLLSGRAPSSYRWVSGGLRSVRRFGRERGPMRRRGSRSRPWLSGDRSPR